MKAIFFAAIFFSAGLANAQVGIGTQTPSPNSVLDVSSSDKGLLLPRIGDTTNVSSPSEGLVIYNMKAKAPAFHDGAKWNTVATSKNAASDSGTYTISNASNGFVNGTFPVSSFGNSITESSSPGTGATFEDVSFLKSTDDNSVALAKSVTIGTYQTSMVVEFKSYTPGASTPNYSIKLTNVNFKTYKVGVSSDGNLTETATAKGVIVGYKNWIKNASFAWNINTNSAATY